MADQQPSALSSSQVFFRMSKLSPLSTSSTASSESADSSPTLCREHDSDKSDESEDLRLKQGLQSSDSTSRNQEKEDLHPVMSMTGKGIIGYLNASEHQEKAYSPAASYILMKSNLSMDAPLKFSDEPGVTGINYLATSPTPTLSSIQSMDSVPESYTRQMMMEHLRCTECKDLLKEPVSIPCGHSFCKSCIQSYWTKSAQIENYSCPQCRKGFTTHPALNLNVTLANVVQTHQQASAGWAVPAQSHAGPEDVACDICTGSKIKAVKTCLTCSVSYCEAHVRKHYTVEALLKHYLMEPSKDLEQGGVNTNTSTEIIVLKDHMSNMMNQMKQLQNQVITIEVKLEDMQRSKTETHPPRKRYHTQI